MFLLRFQMSVLGEVYTDVPVCYKTFRGTTVKTMAEMEM